MCKKEVRENENGIACDRCGDWFHLKCADFKNNSANNFLQNKGLRWYCMNCQKRVDKLVSNDINQGPSSRPGPKVKDLVNLENRPSLKENRTSLSEDSNSLGSGNRTNLTKNETSVERVGPLNLDENRSSSVQNRNLIRGPDDGWTKVSNSRPSRSKPTKNIVIENRFSLLGDFNEKVGKECEFTLVGDSLIRGQESEFCCRGKKARRAGCRPGAKTEDITNIIKSIDDSGGSVIAHVGTNDIVLKPKSRTDQPLANRQSEVIFRRFKELVEVLKNRKRKSYLVSMLPRFKVSKEINSRIIGMNERVKEMCDKAGVSFVDVFDRFYSNPGWITHDGLHLSINGKRQYARILEQVINNRQD